MKNLWTLFLAEFAGTALLVGVGVSIVILDFGQGSPVAAILPDPGLRRLLTGFLFGATGASIAISPLGKASGAHINPVVTLAFWVKGKMTAPHALGYVVSQLAGGIVGSLPLLAWGGMGASIDFGGTFPGTGFTVWQATLGEVVTTVGLIGGLFIFLGHSKLRRYTPLLFPFLYAVMVYLEAPVSGTSTNPARSLGPVLGTFMALAIMQLSWLRRLEVEVAKIYHFEHDPHGVFRPLRAAREA
jgi:aquaporin Z